VITIDMVSKVKRMRLHDQVSFSEIAKSTELAKLRLAQEPQYNDVYHFHGLSSLRVHAG
jgi:hypothetical protein